MRGRRVSGSSISISLKFMKLIDDEQGFLSKVFKICNDGLSNKPLDNFHIKFYVKEIFF